MNHRGKNSCLNWSCSSIIVIVRISVFRMKNFLDKMTACLNHLQQYHEEVYKETRSFRTNFGKIVMIFECKRPYTYWLFRACNYNTSSQTMKLADLARKSLNICMMRLWDCGSVSALPQELELNKNLIPPLYIFNWKHFWIWL